MKKDERLRFLLEGAERSDPYRPSYPVLTEMDEKLKFALEEAERDDPDRSFQPIKEFPAIFNFYLYFEAARNPPLNTKFYSKFANAMQDRTGANPINVLRELKQYFMSPKTYEQIQEYFPTLDQKEFLQYLRITRTPRETNDFFLKIIKIPAQNSQANSWVEKQIYNIDKAIYLISESSKGKTN